MRAFGIVILTGEGIDMLTIADAAAGIEVQELSTEDARDQLAPIIEAQLGISVDEFLRRLDAGDYDAAEDEAVLELVMMAPFAR